jgi:phosphatidylglycerophosphate synthase
MNLFKEFKSSLKMMEVEEVLDIIFYRPFAFLVVKSVYSTNITPNHLTLAAIVMGVAGGCFYSLGTEGSCILGAIFYMLFNILDCSDGQLARLKKNGTPGGRLLDGDRKSVV